LILVLSALLAAAAPASAPPLAITTAPGRPSPCGDASTTDSLVCRALQAQKGGDPAGAAQGFEDAAKAAPTSDPQTGRLWAAGNLWIEANQPARAAAALDRALAAPGLAGPQRGEVLLDRARAAESFGELKVARARLNEAAATISSDPFYWYFSSALAIREGDSATAKSAIDKALSLAPNEPTILFEAGHVADLAGDDSAARRYWMRAAAGDPAGAVGRAAAKAVEMLGVTPTVKSEPQAAK
jgi:tetratricopeptide (TPR) repeat protein